MEAQFSTAQLFGGAILALFPANFIDASNLRQVPDNQEVYVNRDGLESLMFDITERVEGTVDGDRQITSDLDALKFHVEDIVENTNPDITSVSTVTIPHLPANVKSMSCFVSAPTATGNTYTGILLLMIRLAERKTDLIVSLNIPDLSVADDRFTAEQDQLSPRLCDARTAINKVISSLEIKDWDLFL